MSLLEHALNSLIESKSFSSLKDSSENLSSRYRAVGKGVKEDELLAYLQVRMPATFAACMAVFRELSYFQTEYINLLDIGAGPGTASIAACESFPSLSKCILIEQVKGMIDFGKQLCKHILAPTFDWIHSDFKTANFPPNDLVVFSYSLAENYSQAILENAWAQTAKTLVIIEPGTPKHFEKLLDMRKCLIEMGAFILAPCPHMNQCPLKEGWCHFSTRLQRSKAHRFAKGALGYEDEKFCYLIASKIDMKPRGSRVIHSPLKRSGHMHIDLCTTDGIKRETLTKKDPRYKKATKLEWGDVLAED